MHIFQPNATAPFAALLIALSFGVCAISYGQTKPSGAFATVNGVSVPQSLVDNNVKINVAQGQRDSAELRQVIQDELINREVLAQESTRLGLDKTPEAQAQWTQVRQTFLVELLLNDYMARHPIPDAALKTEYDRQMTLMKDQQQYRLGLIVTATEDEAIAVLARLRKGEPFAKVAAEKSIDPSKKEGGNVGWVVPAQIVPAISNVMVNLAKGALSVAPIQTAAGWNIIKLEETRPFKAPTFEEAKNDIRQSLIQKQRFEYVKKLRENAKVIQ